MWCANCRSDVAAEVSVDNRRIHCASCGTELTAESIAIDDSKTRTARELLERWSSKSLRDPFAERAPWLCPIRLTLPAGRFRNALTGRPADGDLGADLAELPVALLVKDL